MDFVEMFNSSGWRFIPLIPPSNATTVSEYYKVLVALIFLYGPKTYARKGNLRKSNRWVFFEGTVHWKTLTYHKKKNYTISEGMWTKYYETTNGTLCWIDHRLSTGDNMAPGSPNGHRWKAQSGPRHQTRESQRNEKCSVDIIAYL